MTKQEFTEEVALVLNEASGSLSPNTEIESLDGWDSAGLLGIIALLDDLGIQINVDRLRQCKTIGDLIDVAAAKLG